MPSEQPKGIQMNERKTDRLTNKDLLGLSNFSRDCEFCGGDLYLHAWADINVYGMVLNCSGETLAGIDNNGNINAESGPMGDRCVCGCTFWKNDKCVQCGMLKEIAWIKAFAREQMVKAKYSLYVKSIETWNSIRKYKYNNAEPLAEWEFEILYGN